MSTKYPGGIIKATVTPPTTSSAPGIWTMEQAGYFKKNTMWPGLPLAPTVGTATAGVASATVTLTPPSDNGYGALTYTATSTPGSIVGSGSSSPITVSGLTNGTAYTFVIKAVTGGGTGPASSASNSVTPIALTPLYSWGINNFGQLGLGNITSYSSPKQVGALTTWASIADLDEASIATKTDGTLWSWGNNLYYGALGLGDTTNRSSPVQVGALTTWLNIATGYRHSLATKTDGTLWAWGSGSGGALGLGNTTNYSSPKQIGALTTWSKISAGRLFSIAIKTDGTLWSWGNGGSGKLGLGNTTYYSSPKQVGTLTTWSKVSCLRFSALAIKTDGTLWGWGDNSDGQLGLGDTAQRNSPVQVGTLTTWLNISNSKNTSTIATKTNGTLWSWGLNNVGQLGLGNTTSYSSPKQVGALTTWSKPVCGYSHSIATKTDGTLWGWGNNGQGQLGLGNITYYSSPKQVGGLTSWSNVSCGTYYTMGVTS